MSTKNYNWLQFKPMTERGKKQTHTHATLIKYKYPK